MISINLLWLVRAIFERWPISYEMYAIVVDFTNSFFTYLTFLLSNLTSK